MKLVINGCFGGFGLSDEAVMRYAEIKGITLYPEQNELSPILGNTYWKVPKEKRTPPLEDWHTHPLEARQASNQAYEREVLTPRNIPRNDPALVTVVEEMGDKASGRCAALEIVEVPDDVNWQIEEYDGNEHVAEAHRTWR
jgi:hypothetical protein